MQPWGSAAGVSQGRGRKSAQGRSEDRRLSEAAFLLALLGPNPIFHPRPVFGAKGCGLFLEHVNLHAPQGHTSLGNQELVSHQRWRRTC